MAARTKTLIPEEMTLPKTRSAAKAVLPNNPKGMSTKPASVVSLNSIMVDGTGMCGGCRVRIGSENKFACVDGPEFDAHQVDFAALIDRLSAYRDFERCAMEHVR